MVGATSYSASNIKILLTLTGDERVWMINQNFQQVLRVVKAAYGGALFEQDRNTALSPNPDTDLERLLCLWKKVEASQADKDANNNVKVEAMIEACSLM